MPHAVSARLRNSRHHVGIGILRECAQEPVGRRVARELVIVEQEPAQDLAPFVVVAGAESTQRFREIVEDHAGLRQTAPAMREHRHLAHDVDGAVRSRARLAPEVVDEPRRPIGPGKFQRQRGFVCVARLREAVKRVLGHDVPRVDPVRIRRWRASARSGRSGRSPRTARRRRSRTANRIRLP